VPLFEALGRLGPDKERVTVTFVGTAGSALLAKARSLGVDHLVKLHRTVPLRQSLQMQREADVLLHLLWNDPDQQGVYNAKIFEYLGARRPILAVGSHSNVTAGLVSSRRAGLATDDPAVIANQLRLWLAQKSESGHIPDLPADVSRGISREEQAHVLERFLERILENRAT
jgi:hypothetical protein